MERGILCKPKYSAARFWGTLVLSTLIPAFAAAASATDNPGHLYLKALLQERAGKLEEAFKNYELVSRQDPDDAFIRETLASASMRLGKMNRALEEGEKVVSLKPDDPHSYMVLGRVRLSRGEVQEAAKAFSKALELDPSDSEALLYSAHLHSTDDPKLAISLYEKFLQNNPHSMEAVSRVADLQQRVGDYSAAEESWRRIVEYEPDNVAAVLSLAHLYEVRRDTPSALGQYARARELDPDNPGLLLRLGELYFRGNRLDEAQECFAAVERLSPRDLTVQFWSALIAEEKNDWSAASRHMGRVGKESRDPAVLLRLAYYQSQNNQPRRALSTLKRLHRRDPRNPEFMYYLAMGYEDIGDYRAAIRWLERVAAVDPGRADVQFRLGVAYDNLKRFDKAEPHLRRAVELNPRNPVALNYLGYTYADKGIHLEESLDLVRRALVLDPENGAFLDSLGWAYFKLGRLDEAREAMVKAIERADDYMIWLHYGDVLMKMGKADEAVEAWGEGLLLEPKNAELKSRLKSKGNDFAAKGLSRRWLKRAEGNLRQIKSLAGQVTLEGSGLRSFQLQGLFYYKQPQLFRFEFLGPMFVPQALLVKNESGLHWSSPEWERSAGDDQDLWLKLFGDFLSGDVFRSFDSQDVTVKAKGRTLVYSGPSGELDIDTARGVVTRLLWKGASTSSQAPLDFRFQDYSRVGGLWLPGKTLCRMPNLSFSFFLDLARTRLNPSLDAVLFDSGNSPASEKKSKEN